jgi:hypothetical protein
MERFQEKICGRLGIARRTQEKLECVSLRVDGSVEVEPGFPDFDVRLIHFPGVVAGFEVRLTAFLQFGSVALHPAPNRRVIDAQASFCHQLFQITIAERETEIPADAKGDDLIREVFSPKEPRPILLHPTTLPKA